MFLLINRPLYHLYFLAIVSLASLQNPLGAEVRDSKEFRLEYIEHLKTSTILGSSHFLERVLLTLSCQDCDSIPKHPDAGRLFLEASPPYQVMHNGLKVIFDGYYSSQDHWISHLIFGLQGHHEPQEELVFHEILPFIPKGGVMVELGAYWGYYSLWFAKDVPDAKNYLIEPDASRLLIGKKNFELNGYPATFLQAYIGMNNNDDANYFGSSLCYLPQFFIDHNLSHIDILHADIQGAELKMLHSLEAVLPEEKISFFFISTHGESIHRQCLAFFAKHHLDIVAEHSPQESFSADGLIVAKIPKASGPRTVPITKRQKGV